MIIKQVTKDIKNELLSLLRKNQLPIDDLIEEINENKIFYLMYMDGQPAGTVGIELYDDCALLRSLAVDEKWQKKGFGNILVSYALEIAEQHHVSEVFLLTTDANKYFQGLHFEEIDRSAVPKPIQHSNQFKEICPSSAVVMHKILQAS